MTDHVELLAKADTTAGNPDRASHVFIVGLPRTGTHLMRDIVKASGRVGFGPEAHFMGQRKRFGVYVRRGLASDFPRGGALTVAQARALLADVFAPNSPGRGRNTYWQRLADKCDPAEFTERFVESRRRAQDLFDLAMRAHAEEALPGDKTPANLWHIQQLLDWYPQARIIHMIRDPRASYGSMLRKGWVGPTRLHLKDVKPLRVVIGAATVVDFAHAWRNVVATDAQYSRAEPRRYLSCRFEDLLVDPERNVRRISNFIDVPFRPEMIERTVITSSYMQRGTEGFQAGAIDAWRRHLDPVLSTWLTRLVRADLLAQKYSVQ